MKKYKLSLISLVTYLAALGWLWFGFIFIDDVYFSFPSFASEIISNLGLVVFFVLLIISMLFGFKSKKAKESFWISNILIFFVTATMLAYILLYMYASAINS